jgi:hypothetical protein
MKATVEAMTTSFYTIAEATAKTGRSGSTIRRLIKTIVDSPSHADREGIDPAPKAVDAFKKKGENFTWRIREDVLLKNFSEAQAGEQNRASKSADKTKEDVLQILHHELDVKNRQIEKQWDVINSLNDRLREGNILMASLQQRLALPAPEASADESSTKDSTEAIQRASKKKVMEAKQAREVKSSVKADQKSSKKGIMAWLLG